jgi:hypothetical protein
LLVLAAVLAMLLAVVAVLAMLVAVLTVLAVVAMQVHRNPQHHRQKAGPRKTRSGRPPSQ